MRLAWLHGLGVAGRAGRAATYLSQAGAKKRAQEQCQLSRAGERNDNQLATDRGGTLRMSGFRPVRVGHSSFIRAPVVGGRLAVRSP